MRYGEMVVVVSVGLGAIVLLIFLSWLFLGIPLCEWLVWPLSLPVGTPGYRCYSGGATSL